MYPLMALIISLPYLCGYIIPPSHRYIQNTSGGKGESLSYFAAANYLRDKFGFGIFFEGIQPKLFRAAVNHSVTFLVYDFIMRSIQVNAT